MKNYKVIQIGLGRIFTSLGIFGLFLQNIYPCTRYEKLVKSMQKLPRTCSHDFCGKSNNWIIVLWHKISIWILEIKYLQFGCSLLAVSWNQLLGNEAKNCHVTHESLMNLAVPYQLCLGSLYLIKILVYLKKKMTFESFLLGLLSDLESPISPLTQSHTDL